MRKIKGSITSPKGFTASAVAADIKEIGKTREDLCVLYSEKPCVAAGVFTKNTLKSGTVLLCHKTLENPTHQGVVALSGIANTLTGDDFEKAQKLQALAANFLHLSVKEVLLASTGKIGKVLPMEPIVAGFQKMPEPDAAFGDAAARAILTSDTAEKVTSYQEEFGGKTVTISAMAKGSGMIHPNMGTTLSFVTTDLAIEKELLQRALSIAVEDTLNMISIDGDMSTNDTCLVLANGMAENPKILCGKSEDYRRFVQLLVQVLQDLAQMIAGDAEGSTKLLTAHVSGVDTKEKARILAKGVISSARFKAAMSGVDGYRGRLLASMGAPRVDFDLKKVKVSYTWGNEKHTVYDHGKNIEFPTDKLESMGSSPEVVLEISMDAGKEEATAYGCDLTEDYIRHVVDYR